MKIEEPCLLQIQTMQSPAVENFVEIEGMTYATGKNGKGLYRLIPKTEARFYNEAEPLVLDFKLKSKKKVVEEMVCAIKKLPNSN